MNKNKTIVSIVATIVLVTGLAHVFRAFDPKPVEAQVVHGNVTGYAWADSVGWISFNCTNDNSCGTVEYGVNIDPADGTISGYAWSSSVGWISFEETTGCPSGTCGAYVDGVSPSTMTGYKAVKGWARALAGASPDSGGWDGWIQLDHNQTNPITYSFENREFKGYAWGGPAVMGWISFNSTDTSSAVSYAVKGPGMDLSSLDTLGSIATDPLCDAGQNSYLEISALTNGNDAANVEYTAYSATNVNGPWTALSAGGLYYGGTQVIFKDYSATSSVSKRYVIYAEVPSLGLSTSTATSSPVSMPGGFSCIVPDPNADARFTTKTFTINPSIVIPPSVCRGTWNVTHDGDTDEVEAACSIKTNALAPVSVSGAGTSPLDVGLHTLSCDLRNIAEPETVYDSFSISRRCYRNADVIER